MSQTLQEFAEKLGIHPETLARRVKKGHVEGVLWRRPWRFDDNARLRDDAIGSALPQPNEGAACLQSGKAHDTGKSLSPEYAALLGLKTSKPQRALRTPET